MPRIIVNIWDFFNARYEVLSNGCWKWNMSVNSDGYGHFGSNLRNRGLTTEQVAHRLAYTLFKGPIPSGMVVMHSCDYPRCVNPEHLNLGTQIENVQDMIRKGRVRGVTHENEQKTHCKRGHKFTKKNTYIYPNSGGRGCKICIKMHHKQYYEMVTKHKKG